MNGYLALILTGHVPYLRSGGRNPDGEDALHETIAHALVPSLNVLFDLRELGVRFTVALAYSPVLLEQLGDLVVQKHFVVWMERWLERISGELGRWEHEGEAHRGYLGRFYLDWGHEILNSFVGRYGRNLVGALRELCTDGTVEPLAGAATHAYLPLLGRAESLRAQLDIGTLNITRLLGSRPRGFWLPECGYSPAIEQQLRFNGTRYIVVDPSSVVAGAEISHLQPRWVATRRLATFVRDASAARQIWSPELGYADDPLYRSLRRDPRSGLGLWRGAGSSLALYDPYDAFQLAKEHAAHFSASISAVLDAFHDRHGYPGIAVVPLDAELLGRRWFEGPAWLKGVIESFNTHPSVALAAPSAYLRAHRPHHSVQLGDGSWGEGGDHRAWGGRAASPLRQAISEAEERLAALVQRWPNAHGERERLLAQALRELLLAQASDWPLLLNQGAPAEEPLRRPALHLRRCEQLCALVEAEKLSEADLAFLEQVEELDNPFPHLNYRVFASGP
jgi:1,4-alpha-glucan branching enzyme